jgi:hypothetical protein
MTSPLIPLASNDLFGCTTESFTPAYGAAFFAIPKRPGFVERIEEKTKIRGFEFAEIEPERVNHLPVANNLH